MNRCVYSITSPLAETGLWVESTSLRFTRGQSITRLFIELREKSWNFDDKNSPWTWMFTDILLTRRAALAQTGSKKEPKRDEMKKLSYFSINGEAPSRRHLHQLNEGVKRVEGKTDFCWKLVTWKEMVYRRAFSVRESWKQGNGSCPKAQGEFH